MEGFVFSIFASFLTHVEPGDVDPSIYHHFGWGGAPAPSTGRAEHPKAHAVEEGDTPAAPPVEVRRGSGDNSGASNIGCTMHAMHVHESLRGSRSLTGAAESSRDKPQPSPFGATPKHHGLAPRTPPAGAIFAEPERQKRQKSAPIQTEVAKFAPGEVRALHVRLSKRCADITAVDGEAAAETMHAMKAAARAQALPLGPGISPKDEQTAYAPATSNAPPLRSRAGSAPPPAADVAVAETVAQLRDPANTRLDDEEVLPGSQNLLQGLLEVTVALVKAIDPYLPIMVFWVSGLGDRPIDRVVDGQRRGGSVMGWQRLQAWWSIGVGWSRSWWRSPLRERFPVSRVPRVHVQRRHWRLLGGLRLPRPRRQCRHIPLPGCCGGRGGRSVRAWRDRW